jgi:hypothetical protein
MGRRDKSVGVSMRGRESIRAPFTFLGQCLEKPTSTDIKDDTSTSAAV